MTRPDLLRLAAAALSLLLAAPASATEAPDFGQFTPACRAAEPFFFADAPLGPKRMEPFCECLEFGFAGFAQPEIDVLVIDMTGEATEASRAAYPGYSELRTRATDVLFACLADPVDGHQPPPPATP